MFYSNINPIIFSFSWMKKKKTYFVQIWKWQSTQSTANQTIKTDADIKIFFFCWINIKIFKSGDTRKKKRWVTETAALDPRSNLGSVPRVFAAPESGSLVPPNLTWFTYQKFLLGLVYSKSNPTISLFWTYLIEFVVAISISTWCDFWIVPGLYK